MQPNTRNYQPAARAAEIDAADLWRQALRGDVHSRQGLLRRIMPAKSGRTTALRSGRQA
jgi:hypothetical protein